jgi:hypothetical protein
MWFLAATVMLTLHAVDGHEIFVTAGHITSLQHRKPGEKNTLFVEGTNCLVNLTDGKFVTVVETCDEIHKLVEDARKR